MSRLPLALLWVLAAVGLGFSPARAAAEGQCGQPVPDRFLQFGRLASSRGMEGVRSAATDFCSESAPGSSAELLTHESGALKALSCIGPSGPEGPSVAWHPNGKIASQGRVTSASGSAQPCGRWSRYFEDGRLRDSGEWADGVPSGAWQVRAAREGALEERVFEGPFRPSSEWAVAFGIDYLAGKDEGGASVKLPGPFLVARRGNSWKPWLYVEAGAGFYLFLDSNSGLGGSRLNLSPIPVLLLSAYWTPDRSRSRWRAGLQLGLSYSLNDSGVDSSGKPQDAKRPFGLLAVQRLLGEERRWFLELGASPPVGSQLLLQAGLGRRW